MSKTQFILCDDNADDLNSLREAVEEYIAARGIIGEALCFSSPEEFLRLAEEKPAEGKAVYILDVVMPAVDGIELGKKIRERDKSAAVIYISTSKEFALDAFEVHAFSYLIKPFSGDKLFSELDGCLMQTAPTAPSPQTISVKTAGGIVGVEASEIIAVEYYAHRLTFHMKSGRKLSTLYQKQPFYVQAEELIKTGSFVRVSASYLVNFRNIRGLKTDEFIMCDGSHYRITRKFAAARQQYIEGEMQNGGGETAK